MYVFNLFDYQIGGFSLMFIGFCEAVFIGWVVGKQQQFRQKTVPKSLAVVVAVVVLYSFYPFAFTAHYFSMFDVLLILPVP